MEIKDRISKQVIVLRKDLNMRKGKMVAQGAHASLNAIFSTHTTSIDNSDVITIPINRSQTDNPLRNWIEGKFTKICVSVNSEAELLEIYNKAKEAGLICSLITDAGLTEFGGIPTLTSCAIGPAWADEVDVITGSLSLL